MDDLIDDDFGNLYADVEVEAKSAINSASTNFSILHTQPPNEEKDDNNNATTNNNNTSNGINPNNNDNIINSHSEKQLNSKCDGKFCSSEKGYESDSSSDDDLNIVLNSDDDDDCKGFSVSAAAGRDLNQDIFDHEEVDDPQKHVKRYRKVDDDSVGVVTCSTEYSRGNWEDNRFKQHVISCTGQVASFHASGSSMVPHGGYGFSLPRYRTILDVDIDAFEEKRWRHPGVDVSDFFNFGFNEETWKEYCISLEQLLQNSYMQSRSPDQDFPKLVQACETLSEHERAAKETVAKDVSQAGSSMKFIDLGERLIGLPKGRAIQVEDSSIERQPSMDLRRPRTWDSDVVIQISVQNSDENCSGSNKEEFHHIDNSEHEKSKSRNLAVDSTKAVHHSSIVSTKESSEKSLGNIRTSSMNGCIQQPMSKSNQMLLDPDNHVEDRNVVFNRYHDHKMNAQTSDDIAEVVETIQKAEVEDAGNACKSDQTETELSLGNRSHFSLTFSCSGSDSEASRDSVYTTPEVSASPVRRLYPGSAQQVSVSTDHESPKSDGTIRLPVYSQQHSKKRSSFWEGRRHHKRRLHKVAEGKTRPDAEPMYRDWLPNNFHRRAERLHDLSCHSGDDSQYDWRCNFSGCSGSERFADNHVKIHHRKYHQRFRDVMEGQERLNWNEDDLHERCLKLDDRDAIYRDWGPGGKKLSPKSMIPFTNRESRRLISNCKNFKEMDIQWRRKDDKIRYGKKTSADACLFDHRNVDTDDLMLHKNWRSIPLTSQKRDSLGEKYEGDIPFVGQGNPCGRRIHYGDSPLTNLENSWCEEIEDEHWDLDHQPLSPWPHRKFSAANEGRCKHMMPPGSTSFESRLTERYGRRRREICGDTCRDSDWVDSYHNIDSAEDVIYSDEHFHQRRRYSAQSGVLHRMQDESIQRHKVDSAEDVISSDKNFHQRRKYSLQSGVLHRMQDESIQRRQVDEFYAIRSSCLYKKSSRDGRTRAKYRSAHDCMTVDDVQLEWNRYRKFNGERSIGFLSRNRDIKSVGEHEWTARRYSLPVNLIFGEGKLSGRFSNAESSKSNGISERMDLKFSKEQKILRNFNGTRTERAIRSGIAKIEGSQIDERSPYKFPVMKHDGYLDIEEGQFVPEEPIIEERLNKKQTSENTSLRHNMKKAFHGGNESNKRYDDQRILESLAKMERRRERFKVSIALKKESDKSMKPQIDMIADTIEIKEERPARKRRWGGN